MRMISLIGVFLVISLMVLSGCTPNSTLEPPTSSSSPLPSSSPQPASTSPVISPPITSPSPLSSIENPLKVEVTTDKSTYLPGEDVTITLSFRNTANSSVVIDPYPPEVTVTRLKYFHWGDERIRTFAAGTEARSLGSGRVITCTLTWDQMDDQG